MRWLNKVHRGFNRLWLILSCLVAFAFTSLNVLIGGYKVVYPLNPYFIWSDRVKTEMTETEKQQNQALVDKWYEQEDKRQKTKVWKARGRFVRDLLGSFIVTFALGHGVFFVVWWIVRGFR